MTRQDILAYLNNLRKSSTENPVNRWVGTYNGRQMIFLKFFKWLYYPDEDYRNRFTPICLQGVRKLPRKEKTSYKPSDIWEANALLVIGAAKVPIPIASVAAIKIATIVVSVALSRLYVR